ncbi:MAG TPA: M14 family metallopeptidase, partial [Gammaproteobacteria bacterium]|nr:M14 family metallopeptidase [Gammaproteobacteria bacterium]
MSEGNYPVELEAPDISPYQEGNTGVDYVYTFDSNAPGPHVMVSAVVHGNELCGAIVLDFLLKNEVRPVNGKLTLGFMNVDAYRSFDPADPGASRFLEEDFNRIWSGEILDGKRNSAELKRAREVRPIIEQVDYLLDVHSMQHPTVPLLLCGPKVKGQRLARAVGAPMHIVADAGHSAGIRMRDYGEFVDESSHKNSLLIECGQHWSLSSADVAKDVVLRFLGSFEILDPEFIDQHLEHAPPPMQHVIQVTAPVTIETDQFQFVDDYYGMEIIPKAGT